MGTYVPNPQRLTPGAAVPRTADGDEPTGANLGGPQEVAFDAIAALEAKVYDEVVNLRRHKWRPSCLLNCREAADTDAWGGTGTTYAYGSVVGLGAGPYIFELELDVAQGCELNEVQVWAYDYNENGAIVATVSVWRLDFQSFFDAGGDIDELPGAQLLGSDTSFTAAAGKMGYFLVSCGNEVVDRSRYRYVAQVVGTAGDSGDRWFSARVSTDGREIDKAAG